MEHSFNIDIATTYGIKEAVLLNHLNFWVEHNRANGVNCFDGEYWTFNSVKAFTSLFPYMRAKGIRTALDKLECDGLIKVSNFNVKGYDRTKWYTLTEKGETLVNTHFPKTANAFVQKGKPIPDINTDTNIICASEVEDFFNQLWKLYPIRIGKGSVSLTKKKVLYKIGLEEMTRAIERYCQDNKDNDKKYWKHGSTFFNTGYIDYLDVNYEDKPNTDMQGLRRIEII